MSRTITFKSLRRNTTYVLTIADGSNTVTALTPSATPFVTEVDNSEDFFAPVRSQSGTIEIIGEVSDVEPLLSSNPSSRLVTLQGTDGSTTTLRWKGYLQTSALSQTWDKGPIPLSFPVKSHLGIIESYNFNRTDYVRFAEFFKSMNECTGTAFYSSFVFPNLADISTILKYNFSGQAFADFDDNSLTFTFSDYKHILEEICKLFGWVAIEMADTLCLLAPDSTDGYVKFTAADITTLSAGGTATGTAITQNTITEEIDGASHTIDYQPGMKCVKVTGKPGNSFGKLFDFDVNRLEIKSTEDYNRPKSSGSTEYYHYFSKNYGDSPEIDVTYSGNIRYDNFYYDNENLRHGSCCVTDRQLQTDSNTTPNPVEKDTNWISHIICKPTYEGQNNIFSINPIRQHIASGLMSELYIAIKFSVKRSDSYKDDWEAVDNARIGMTVTLGEVNFERGKFDSSGNIVDDPNFIYSTPYIPVNVGDVVTWVYGPSLILSTPVEIIPSSFFYTQGDIRSHAQFSIYKFAVTGGGVYAFTGTHSSSVNIPFVCWYDANGNFISLENTQYASVTYTDEIITAPSNAAVAWLNVANGTFPTTTNFKYQIALSNACLIEYDNGHNMVDYWTAYASNQRDITISHSTTTSIRASFPETYRASARLLINGVEVYRPSDDFDTLMNNNVTIKDGTPYYGQAGYANSDGCVALLAPTTKSGPLHIQFNLLPDFFGYPYVSFENISVNYVNVWRRHLENPSNENTTEYEIENGFTETLEQSNKLTTQRPEFANQITSEQIGWGLVLDDSLEPIMKLYDNKYPEEALAGRMRDHYSVSKKRITAQLLSRGELFDPIHLHAPGSGDGMVCLSQSVNWRDDQIEAALYEL